ncbi:MAG TPA: PAS domain S-box protein [Syntrophomonadaceae bacterium]|nr:PAS domain S-box protein [Syntrophomonadaceae bacterium]
MMAPEDGLPNRDKPGSRKITLEMLAEVLSKVNGMFCVYDTEGNIKFANQKFKDLLDYPEEVLYKMNISGLAVERHKKRIRDRIRVQIEAGKERTWEMPIRGRDGTEFSIICRTSPFYQEGIITGEILMVEDITERKRTEAELRESQRRMADIIESLPDATVVIDKAGRILYWNREMVDLTGFPASSMVGRDNYEYSIPFYGIRRPILLDMIVDENVRFDKEYVYVRRDGDVLYTETKTGQLKGKQRILWGRAAPLYNTKGEIVGAIESVRDISDRKQAEEDLIRSHEKLEAIFSGTVNALAITTEKRDQYTAGHQHRVATLACEIAREMGLPDKTIDDIRIAGTLHDIGKLYVPLDILSQPGRLSEIEYLFIKTHPTAGYDILKSIPFDAPIAEIIMQHHERVDGTGYPKGLKGEEILLPARIIAVADVFEAMASHRPYRASLGIERALEEIQKNAGVLYDRDVVEACIRLVKNKEFESIFEDKQ